MTKPLPSPHELRLLLIPGGATPPKVPPKDATGSRLNGPTGPTLLPLSLPYPSAPEVMVDFFVSGQSIYELNRSCRSVGTCSALLPPELVLSDASLLLATPIDPLLLLLPHLKQHASSSFVSLLDAVASHKLDLQIRRNLQAVAQHPAVLRRLHFACDIRLLNATKVETEEAAGAAADHTEAAQQGPAAAATAVSAEEGKKRLEAALGGTLFVRLNMDKTLAFLLRKHAKLAAAIAMQRGLSSSSSNNSSSSNGSSSNSSSENSNLACSPPDSSSNALSFSLLSAYLTAQIAASLEQRLKKDGLLRGALTGAPEKTCIQRPTKDSSESSSVAATAAAAAAAKPQNSSKTGTRLKRAAGTAASGNTRKTQVKKKAP
ncbi:hypothetical protein, conserved [Eimeria acervulina]|uniref:Uncharacterized protein n=1 Tax=Eimeria acervulina TaxID=5801 RepID=U6GVD8_EIMAC|nr:hypothetical protein, conserved [Eimeria acervulina]CDI83263.1 hypothetical protein, conserved [Eimeria acervulina]